MFNSINHMKKHIHTVRHFCICLLLGGILTSAQAQQNELATSYSGNLDSRGQSIISNLSEKETTKRLRIVKIDPGVFETDQLLANLFDDYQPSLIRQDIGRTGVSMRTWTGLTTTELGSGAFVLNGNRISGHITSSKGNYEVFPLGDAGIHAIVEHDISQFRACGTENSPEPPPSPGLPDDGRDNDMDEYNRPRPEGNRSVIGEECFVRVIVAYTPLAQSETDDDFGRTMIEHISLAVTESNQGYANSDVDMRMELAYMYETTDNETINACNDVDDLQATSDGKWDEVHTHRNSYDGDMVCLVTGGLYATNPDCNPNGGLCGRAFGFDYTDPTNMFQVSEYDCVTGNFTFAHEFGHTQGARHDTDNTGTPFSYARGYNQGANFRTIMAVCCTPNRVNFWSNPDIDHPSCNCATGTATRDNARALDVGDATVAHHRETPGTFSTGIDVDDDEWLNMLTSTLLNSTNEAASGSLLELKSFTEVRLLPGFHAFDGSEGRYYIAPNCPGTTYSLTEGEQNSGTVVPDADGTIPGVDEVSGIKTRQTAPANKPADDGQHAGADARPGVNNKPVQTDADGSKTSDEKERKK